MRTAPALVVVDTAVTEALDPVLLLSAYREALAGIGVTDVPDGQIIAGFGRGVSCLLDEFIDDRQLAWLALRRAVRLFSARVLRDLAERHHPTATAAGEAMALAGHDRLASVASVAAHHAHVQAGHAAGVGHNVAVGWTVAGRPCRTDVVTPAFSTAVEWLVGDAQVAVTDQRKRRMTSRSTS